MIFLNYLHIKKSGGAFFSCCHLFHHLLSWEKLQNANCHSFKYKILSYFEEAKAVFAFIID